MDDLRLYEVVLRSIKHDEARVLVASGLGPSKAVALAVVENQAKSKPLPIFDVAVTDLGRAPKPVPAKALIDRMEF